MFWSFHIPSSGCANHWNPLKNQQTLIPPPHKDGTVFQREGTETTWVLWCTEDVQYVPVKINWIWTVVTLSRLQNFLIKMFCWTYFICVKHFCCVLYFKTVFHVLIYCYVHKYTLVRSNQREIKHPHTKKREGVVSALKVLRNCTELQNTSWRHFPHYFKCQCKYHRQNNHTTLT